jgi:predicted solute-binding protein
VGRQAENLMRLLIDETLATAPLTFPLAAGWVSAEQVTRVDVHPNLRASHFAAAGDDVVALVPLAEVTACQQTHIVAPDLAVVAGYTGAIVARMPLRPDAIDRTVVHLWQTGSAAEVLARATLRPFYGIEPASWVTDADAEGAAEARVVVTEGVEALRPLETGFAEDLCRAWFIMTGMPAVTHLLLVPRDRERGDLATALTTLDALRQTGHQRRREIRRELSARHDLPLDSLNALFSEQRLVLTRDDRGALSRLLTQGLRGSAYPPLTKLEFLDDA